jgi:hypothetical protein
MRAIKQRSPAGARWAESATHQIEKMLHGELSILGAEETRVKLLTHKTLPVSCIAQTASSAFKKLNQFIPRKPVFPQQRHQSSFWDIAVVPGTTARRLDWEL